MDTYPKRPAYFAHKLVRLMLHSCAAQEIGPDGFLVVTAIAHAEDAKRYSGAVSYWNEQLIPILGFGSWGQLDRARKKAIAGGWLHYEEGGKGKVGKYWTTVPEQLLDAPDVSTEADHHVILSNSGEDYVKETGKKRERNVREPGDNRGTSGEHSTLPLPLPLSALHCTAPKQAQKKPKTAKRWQGDDELATLAKDATTPLPLGKVNGSSVFDGVTDEWLRNPTTMIGWFRRQLGAASPVLPGNRAEAVFVLCCASRSTDRGIKNPVGMFTTLVTTHDWESVKRFKEIGIKQLKEAIENGNL